jgi:hypothetical protein
VKIEKFSLTLFYKKVGRYIIPQPVATRTQRENAFGSKTKSKERFNAKPKTREKEDLT